MKRPKKKDLEQFSLRVSPVHSKVPVDGLIALSLYLTYTGEGQVDLQQIGPDNIGFTPPAGWALKDPPGLRSLHVRSPGVQLSKGQTWEHTIHLRDYFSSITPGKVNLEIVLTIWREESPQRPINLKDTCALEVVEEL